MIEILRAWREITDQATEGSWVVGDHDHIQGASHCECRPEYGPLVWEGEMDINGEDMLTHIHRRDGRPWGDDTSIYSTGLPDPVVVALSTTEYVAISPEDARFIATAKSEMVPALLTAVENVLALHSPWPSDSENPHRCSGCDADWPDCDTVTAIRDALVGAQ